jgi:excisionase family DNA binding protein
VSADLATAVVADALEGAPALLTLKAAAERTGIPVRTWHRYLSKGLVRAARVAGGHPRLPRVEVERVLREGLEA